MAVFVFFFCFMAIVSGQTPFRFFWTFLYCISTLCFGGRLPGESRDDDTHDTIEALVLNNYFYHCSHVMILPGRGFPQLNLVPDIQVGNNHPGPRSPEL